MLSFFMYRKSYEAIGRLFKLIIETKRNPYTMANLLQQINITHIFKTQPLKQILVNITYIFKT